MSERIMARLVYDTKAQPPTSGIRAVAQRARRLLYAADETELVLQIAPGRRPEQLTLAGQVLDEGMPIEGAAVTLQGPASAIDKVTDEEGEFVIGALPPGMYSLEVDTRSWSIGVSPLEVE
jgi:protocatechuate 3,4-dioxygenase beta subunit